MKRKLNLIFIFFLSFLNALNWKFLIQSKYQTKIIPKLKTQDIINLYPVFAKSYGEIIRVLEREKISVFYVNNLFLKKKNLDNLRIDDFFYLSEGILAKKGEFLLIKTKDDLYRRKVGGFVKINEFDGKFCLLSIDLYKGKDINILKEFGLDEGLLEFFGFLIPSCLLFWILCFLYRESLRLRLFYINSKLIAKTLCLYSFILFCLWYFLTNLWKIFLIKI